MEKSDDMIFPEEITVARGLFYTEAALKHLAETVPSKGILSWCQDNGYVVVAGPPSPMGLLGVRSLEPQLFDPKVDRLCKGCAFGEQDTVKTDWLAIRKEPAINSVGHTWEEQLRLLTKYERVPNAGEMSWFVTTFYKVRGIRLLEQIRVRVASSALQGEYHIHVGEFDEKGFDINECWDGRRTHLIGLAIARKL